MNVNQLVKRTGQKFTNRRFLSIFDNKNNIQSIRQKYYSNPAVGEICKFKWFDIRIFFIWIYFRYQGAENPTYLKEPTDKAIFGAAILGLTIGVLSIGRGLYNMSFGINKIK